MLHSKKSHKGNWEILSFRLLSSSSSSTVAFEEIPQRELRESPPPCGRACLCSTRCCIRRNPTKGIERKGGTGTARPLQQGGVAFEEIPQRELRVYLNFQYLTAANTSVAFEEIPQRELRELSEHHSHPPLTSSKVAFEEIPQRELRGFITGLWAISSGQSCIRRNPTKGIER